MGTTRVFSCSVAMAFFVTCLAGVPLFAQAQPPASGHEQHQPQSPAQDHAQHATAGMTQFSPREGSGTSWLPDSTPMFGVHAMAGAWELMAHGSAFVQLLHENAPEHRGATQGGSINWGMLMAKRRAGSGRVGLRAMVSLEPWTIPGCGYPVLLATGEVCEGDTIHDLQHPHDLMMELAAEYDRPLAGSIRWQIYAGLAGEPALGPTAFPHRVSALPNPLAPISHHWLDATHISFGLVTTGIYGTRWKGEVSAFNGREPDENRLDLDLAALDSVAARLSFLPAGTLALQVSAGRLSGAEAGIGGFPRTDVTRFTASAIYQRQLGERGFWATTAAYGVNSETDSITQLHQTTHGGMIETTATANGIDMWFGRLELVGKPADDLHVHELIESIFIVGRVQAGYVRYWPAKRGWQPGVGGSVSASMVPPLLAPRYGGRVAPGFGLFVTLRPARHAM